MAGGAQTCYKVRVTRDGQTSEGYVIGSSLPAIQEFAAAQHAKLKTAMTAAPFVPPPPPKAASADASAAPKLPAQPLGRFEDFLARDASGKMVQFASLRNKKAILVTFWTPASRQSLNRLNALSILYDQFNLRGLAAVGISPGSPSRISGALDDTGVRWPQVPDATGLASKYKVDPKDGATLVVDSQGNIWASTTDAAEVRAAVALLLASK